MPSITEDFNQSEDLEVFVDAEEDLPVSVEELQESLADALILKISGNTAFKSSEYDAALTAYKSAMELLPELPLQSKLEEVTDDQADSERQQVHHDILDLRKALWANMAAVHVKKSDDKEVIKACTEALTIDPEHVKSLHRRAIANDHLSTWSSLTSAQTDYELLLKLLPTTSPLRSSIRTSLTTLPPRITMQQEKEKDEMIGKLKELGDGILGKFGLSTNMFKFDQQEGGGYSMRFER